MTPYTYTHDHTHTHTGIRPDKHSYKLFCEGFIKLRDDLDYALSSYESLRKTAVVGGTKLLDRRSLSSLLSASCAARSPRRRRRARPVALSPFRPFAPFRPFLFCLLACF